MRLCIICNSKLEKNQSKYCYNKICKKEGRSLSKKRYANKNRDKINAKAREYGKKRQISKNEDVKSIRRKSYHKNKNKNIEKRRAKAKKFRSENKEKIKIYNKTYRSKEKTKEKEKLYRINNRKRLNELNLKSMKIRKNNNITYKISCYMSTSIYLALKRMNSSKNNLSWLSNVNYSIQELKEHLESKFETWMNWDNWGVYRPQLWDDNDSSTWKWQIDHIIPKSNFDYQSMSDNNFETCWALENLRPYSAKQNILDGRRK